MPRKQLISFGTGTTEPTMRALHRHAALVCRSAPTDDLGMIRNLILTFGVLATAPVAWAQQGAAPVIVGATVMAESLPVGYRVSGVALEYSGRLDLGTEAIPLSAFSVVATLDP